MAKPKNKLEYLRKINFLSQKEVAELLGISQQFYNKIEHGNSRLSMDVAKKLKTIFKVATIDELLDEVKTEAS